MVDFNGQIKTNLYTGSFVLPLEKYSASLAPRMPVEKFSIDRTGSIDTRSEETKTKQKQV